MFSDPVAHLTKDGRRGTFREFLSKSAESAGVFAAGYGRGERTYVAGFGLEGIDDRILCSL